MRRAVKIMLIPITGCIAIGLIFLFIVLGGRFDLINDEGLLGNAVADLGAHDGVLANTGECDADLYSPVCGYDGATYDNACLAVRAGTTVSHRGQCGPR